MKATSSLLALLLLSLPLQAAEIDFSTQIAPLISAKCLACHNSREPEGHLDLSSKQTAFAGGDSGVVLVTGELDKSYLWERVSTDEMPPEHPLSMAEKQILKQWIEQGARWDGEQIDPLTFSTENRAGYDWWSLRQLTKPDLPVQFRGLHPVDAFIRAQLAEQSLKPSPRADERTLIRRLSFDLLGLPPSEDDVDAFETDASDAASSDEASHEKAWNKLVDRLLASPHYGERWARHWLDLARFGESQGFERDKLRENAWPYRDWVIGALNDDMPYDQFARLQIAGDALLPGDASATTATGFLVAGPYDEVGQSQQSAAMRAVVRQDEMEDYIGTVCQTFLGLTVNCARCHDHKFDPITQTDYYRIASALAGVRAGERPLKTAALERQLRIANRRLAEVKEQIAVISGEMDSPTREQLLAGLTAEKKALLLRFESEAASLAEQIESLSNQRVYAVTPREPEVTHVLLRGNPASPAEEVGAGGIPSLKGLDPDFGLAKDAPEAARRKQLASWITSERNPLFARVIVNRLWHYHFGAGLVASPNDFGFNGSRPTHPELLDYLAVHLIENHWSLKAVHRLIVTSETYRQSSKPKPDAISVDAGNRWLWRYAPQRLEGEVIRDALLKATGTLNPQSGGPSYRNFETFNRNSQFYVMQDRVGPEYHRRTIYRMWVRSGRNRLLDAFDCPDPSVTTPDRAVTTTPTQSLSLLNNSFVLRMADELAKRIVNSGHESEEDQVGMAYRSLFQREPHQQELVLATSFAKQHGLPALARVLVNTNEFLFIE